MPRNIHKAFIAEVTEFPGTMRPTRVILAAFTRRHSPTAWSNLCFRAELSLISLHVLELRLAFMCYGVAVCMCGRVTSLPQRWNYKFQRPLFNALDPFIFTKAYKVLKYNYHRCLSRMLRVCGWRVSAYATLQHIMHMHNYIQKYSMHWLLRECELPYIT